MAGGYLGALNQAIRVQLVDATHFTWGYDNASPLYRVRVTSTGGARRLVEMLTTPKDQPHWPLAGQIVEFLPWSAVLSNRTTGGGALDRCEKLAELSGRLARVDSSFNPSTNQFTIAAGDALPVAFGDEWQARADAAQISPVNEAYLYMRVWNRGSDTASPLAIPFVPGTPVPLQNTGLQVTFTGNQRRTDLFWVIGARPETPQVVTPWQLDDGRVPHGTRLYRTPLGIIEWTADGAGNVTGTVVDDCRDTFLPLTKIRSCCRYTVGDGISSVGHFTSIQAAINALPPSGGEVCVLPGTYREAVTISNRIDVTVHGCGRRSRIIPPPGGGNTPVAAGITIIGSRRIQIERLAVIAPVVAAGPAPVQPSAPGIQVNATPLSSELLFEELYIEAGPSSGIQILGGRFVAVLDCELHQRDLAGPFAALFSAADDVLIERNHLTVDGRETAAGGPPNPGQVVAGRGGLQLGGGSERVRVINNLIEGGIGHGITLGHLIQVGGNNPGGIIVWVIDPNDPCDPCNPGDVVIIVIPGDDSHVESAGALYDILIERNRIYDMGLCGVGVVGFFAPETKQMITVVGLTIIGNRIRRCLRRPIAVPPASMTGLVGYGGIAVAAVQDFVVRDNEIADNGPSQLEAVCGIFALQVEGADIDRNHVLRTGAKNSEPAANAKPGMRGGIVLGLALSPPESSLFLAANDLAAVAVARPRPRQLHAARVHDNVVLHPLGRALMINAIGPVSVQGNRLVSQGMPPRGVDIIGSAVWLVNLGVSGEVPLRLLVSLFAGMVQLLTSSGTGTLSLSCAAARTRDPNDALLRPFLPSGKTLFNDNQVTLDLTGTGQALCAAAVFGVSLDDIGFADNQCDADLDDQVLATNILLAALTVRMPDNRISEGWVNAAYSAMTLGFLNATTNNQSTHCIYATAFRADLLVNTGNVALLAGFCPDLCRRAQ